MTDSLDVPLLPLRNQVVLPCGPALGNRGRARVAVATPARRALLRTPRAAVGQQLALFVQRDPVDTAIDDAEQLYPIGVLATVTAVDDSGAIGDVQVEATARVRLDSRGAADGDDDAQLAKVTPVADGGEDDPRAAELLAALKQQAKVYLDARYRGHREATAVGAMLDGLTSLGAFADIAATLLTGPFDERVAMLQASDVVKRAGTALTYVTRQATRQRELAELRDRPLRDVWPLREGGEQELERRVASGAITEHEGARVREFIDKGYTVLEGAIPHELCDRLLADIRTIGQHPGRFATTDHKRGRFHRLTDEGFDAYESIYDLYVNFESSRQVCFHEQVLRFLEIVFDEQPVAFQQLLFQRSNQHPMHQDTAYVCVEDPLLIIGSWIALEDVVAGRGELTYLEGSHRIEHLLYADGSKRFDPEFDDAEATRQQILDRSAALGCEQRDFLAKKGDVLLWAADLVHGSRPRTRPDHETRLSCVTHYCPRSTTPIFFKAQPHHRGLRPFGERALLASPHYRLDDGRLDDGRLDDGRLDDGRVDGDAAAGEGYARPDLMVPLPS